MDCDGRDAIRGRICGGEYSGGRAVEVGAGLAGGLRRRGFRRSGGVSEGSLH
jgi:hypothetical protein